MRGLKQERILRVLLENDTLSKNEISKMAECSRQWVILFLRELEKKKLVKDTAITDKKELYNYWFSIHKKPRKWREYMIRDPLELLNKTAREYALTTYQAENVVQHYLFPSRIDIYIREADFSQWHELMTSHGLVGKGNVRLILSDSHIMYRKRKINGLSIVCIPQLIIDLLAEGGSAYEAGEMLLKNNVR